MPPKIDSRCRHLRRRARKPNERKLSEKCYVCHALMRRPKKFPCYGRIVRPSGSWQAVHIRDKMQAQMHTLVLLASAGAWILAHPGLCPGADKDGIQFFETKIRPVLATQCFGCHSAQAPKLQGGLSLDSQSGIRKGGNSGIIIDSGQPDHFSCPTEAVRGSLSDLM